MVKGKRDYSVCKPITSLFSDVSRLVIDVVGIDLFELDVLVTEFDLKLITRL